MHCIVTIVRYPKWLGWAGFLSMALFRLPMWFNKKCSFWKLLGCGKNGTFDIRPDWRQWGILSVTSYQLPVTSVWLHTDYKQFYGSFIAAWWRLFNCKTWTLVLEPIEGHGTWDGKECFGALPKQTDYEGTIAVLTRATIRLSRLKKFWKHVDGVVNQMKNAEGFITSVGIGEVPWIKQATLSFWQSKAAMKKFAYQMQQHAEVVRKTRQENWYSEDMFVRFKVNCLNGDLEGFKGLGG